MKQQTRHRLAWVALAFAVVVVLLMSGCAMFEERMNTMKGLVGMAPDKEIIECTSNTETGCEGWVESGTTTE
tara:strand:+ start:125 stop:340 length:216 start_codon:yes stop_codon:yes gene_type:complete